MRRDLIDSLEDELTDLRTLIADKDDPCDKRKLAIAATNLEQAILWIRAAAY